MSDEGGALRSLLAFFRIQVDSEQLEKADDKIGEFFEKLQKLAVGGIWGELAHKSVEFFEKQVEGAAHLQDLSERLDIGVDDLKAFGFAAKGAGLDADAAAGMLSRFERQLSGAGKGGGGAAAELAKLGIKSQGRETLDVITDLADAFESMPTHAEKVAAAIKVFGRQGIAMVPILEKGRAALEGMFEESRELGSGLGGDFYKNAKEAREEFEHFEFAIESLKDRALAAVLPYIIKVGSWLKEGAKAVIEYTKHTNVLKTGILFLSSILVAKLIPALYSAAEALGLLEAETLIPLVGLALLYFAFNDLYTLMTGGNSVIGAMLDKFFGLGASKQFVMDITESFDALIDVLENVGDIIEQMVITPFETAWDLAKGLVSAFVDLQAGNVSAAKIWEDLKGGASEAVDDYDKRNKRVEEDVSDVGEDFTGSRASRARTRANRKALPGVENVPVLGAPESYGSAPFVFGQEPTAGPGAAGGGRAPVRAPIPGASGGGRGDTIVHQNVDVGGITVKPDTGASPGQYGAAAKEGVKRALSDTAKDNANTLNAVTPP